MKGKVITILLTVVSAFVGKMAGALFETALCKTTGTKNLNELGEKIAAGKEPEVVAESEATETEETEA